MFSKTCVQSLIDTDFYKLTMQQGYLHQIPNAEAVWEFRCRSQEDLVPYVGQIREQLEALKDLYVTEDQLHYLHSCAPYLREDYLAFLRLFRFNMNSLDVGVKDNQLAIRVHGPQLHISPFEIPVLATVSEIRNKMRYPQIDEDMIYRSTARKIQQLERLGDSVDLDDFIFFDFGTRRRLSYRSQYIVADMLKNALPKQFQGTSNPHIARELKLPCVGTMAHEWLQTHQGLNYRLVDSQNAALENWVKEYRGDLGVALTDVIGVDAFCADLDRYFAKLYDGFRHDSGDPIVWGEKIIRRLEELRVDPSQKTLVFSDSLDFERAVHIYKYFKGRVKTSFGIGTWLMGDFDVNEPINVVMKMISLNGQPVAKISDSPGKTMCQDRAFLTYLMDVFHVKNDVRQQILANLKD